MSSSLEGRVAVVFGVANKRSIAWSIAQGLHQAGAKLAITYQNERLEMEAKDLILSLPGAEAYMCDVSDDAAIAQLFGKLKERYGKLHVLVHSVAFAPSDAMKGEFVRHFAGRLPHCPRRQRVFAGGACPRGSASDGRWWQHYHHDLLRSRAGCAPLQRHGSGKGCPGVYRSLPRLRSGKKENPGQCDFGWPHQDVGRAGCGGLGRDAEGACRAGAAAAERGCKRSGSNRRFSGFRCQLWNHRRGDLRGLRL